MHKVKRGLIAFTGLVLLSPAAWALPAKGAGAPGLGQALGKPVSAQTLATNRGGHIFQLGSAQLSAQLDNNQAFGSSRGKNIVSQQAFAGSSGIPTLIQNTGNNVVIQNATVVNVQLQ